MLFTFIDAAIFNDATDAVEIAYGFAGEKGIVRIPLRTFRELMNGNVSQEQAINLYHQNRQAFEKAAERMHKARRFEQPGVVVLRKRDLSDNY